MAVRGKWELEELAEKACVFFTATNGAVNRRQPLYT